MRSDQCRPPDDRSAGDRIVPDAISQCVRVEVFRALDTQLAVGGARPRATPANHEYPAKSGPPPTIASSNIAGAGSPTLRKQPCNCRPSTTWVPARANVSVTIRPVRSEAPLWKRSRRHTRVEIELLERDETTGANTLDDTA